MSIDLVSRSKTFNLIKLKVLLLGTQINGERGEALSKRNIMYINFIIHSTLFSLSTEKIQLLLYVSSA